MDITLITLLTIVAAGVGTLTGFGTSTIMVPVLVLFFPLAPTLLLVGVIHWFGDIWKIVLFRTGLRWRLILLFGVPGVVLTFVGARLVFLIPEALLSRVLGGFLILYVLYLFRHPSFAFPERPITAATGGALSGFFAGIFGVGGAVRDAFLAAFNLPKHVYLATAGAIGLVVDSTRIATYLSEGARVAKALVDRIPERQFRAVIAVFLLLVGVKLLVFA